MDYFTLMVLARYTLWVYPTFSLNVLYLPTYTSLNNRTHRPECCHSKALHAIHKALQKVLSSRLIPTQLTYYNAATMYV